MANGFYSVESNIDNSIKRKKRIEALENALLQYSQQVQRDGLTDAQRFLIKYYDSDEDVSLEKINFANAEALKHIISPEKREQIEKDRYEMLINMLATFKKFNSNDINYYNDRFHRKIEKWEDFTKDFEQDPPIVKKMRNLQMLNRMAHEYTAIFRTILYGKLPGLNNLNNKQKRKVEIYIDKLFLGTQAEKEEGIKELQEIIGNEETRKWINNKAIKFSLIARKWMFSQKIKYLIDILEELQENDKGYNYGLGRDGYDREVVIFDVPKYGQFSVHFSTNERELVKRIKLLGIKEYEGTVLGSVNILSKADQDLLKNVDYDKLSARDKQKYKILIQEIKEEKIDEKEEVENEEVETEREAASEEKVEGEKIEQREEIDGETKVEKLIEESKDQKKSRDIVNIIKEAGLKPEVTVNKTILEKGNPKVVKDLIEYLKDNEYGIGVEILTRCKTLLAVKEEKAIDLMEMLEKIGKLGIDYSIIEESPNFLTVSKSDKLESIYEVLKKYKIELTNKNIAVAFEGNAQNITKNLDLVIENGLYEFAKEGVNKFFTSNNKNLNMRVNLFNLCNTPLTTEKYGKRKINANLFKKETDLMEEYGIYKKQVLDELSKIRGQKLIKNSKYYIEEEKQQKDLTDEQEKICDEIYNKLNQYQLEDDVVIKIGDYFYSAIKVRNHINSIIANLDIHNLENEDVNEIIKIALLKNKNITKEEMNELSKQIQNLDKKELQQEEMEADEGEQKDLIEDETAKSEEQDLLDEKESEETVKDEKTEEITKYAQIREMTNNIKTQEKNIENIKQIISHLKEIRKDLKHKIKEMEEQISQNILENEETNEEVIQDIKKLKEIVSKQKEKRKEVKQMIKRYKENKKTSKYNLKQEKEKRDRAIDELEL